MIPNNTSRQRWLDAQKQEAIGVEKVEELIEWIRVRRTTWSNLINRLDSKLTVKSSTSLLDIGSGPTSIFLAIKKGNKFAIDPIYEYLFKMHPFLKELEEYKDVIFSYTPIEEYNVGQQFELIFMINMLDHVGDLNAVRGKVDQLLAPGGTLVILVDSYSDKMVRDLIKYFDVDLPHPHHFINQDIIEMFSKYLLIEKDDKIYELVNEPPFMGKKNQIEIYRIDKFFNRMVQHLRVWGRSRDIIFTFKFIVCYTATLLVTVIRRKEKPLHPLKKLRLFLFLKPRSSEVI